MNEKTRIALSPEVAALSQGSVNAARNAEMLSTLRDEYDGGPAEWLLAEPTRNPVDSRPSGQIGLVDRLLGVLGQPPNGGATDGAGTPPPARRALRSVGSR